MPILYAGTTMPISVAAGQTLVIKELTGTATAAGSIASREDASASIGAGFVVYGPQPGAATISLTTTGVCEWRTVSGDATPARGALNPAVFRAANEGRVPTAVIGIDSRSQLNINEYVNGPGGSLGSIRAFPRRWNLACALSGQRVKLVQNAGVIGDTLAGALARIYNDAPGAGFGAFGTPGTAVATSPGLFYGAADDVWFEGGINDLIALGSTAAATFSTAAQIMDTVLAAGQRLFVVSPSLPTASYGSYTAAKAQETYRYWDMLKGYVASHPGAYYVPVGEALVDPVGTTLASRAGEMPDNIHEDNVASMRAAVVMADVMRRVYAPRTDLLPTLNVATYALNSTINQWFVNPLFQTSTAVTATGFTGNSAVGYTGNGSSSGGGLSRTGSATCAMSLASHLNDAGVADGLGNALVFTTNFTAANETIQFWSAALHTQHVEGNGYYAVCEIDVLGSGGAALTAADNLKGVQLNLEYTLDGTALDVSFLTYSSSPVESAYPSGGRFTMLTPIAKIPRGSSLTRLQAKVIFTSAGAGTPVLRVSRFGIIPIQSNT